MLLPSALDCAPNIQPLRSLYTTNTLISPPPPHRQTTTSPANIFSTCRALQSLIATTLPSPHTISKAMDPPPSLASPIALVPATQSDMKSLSHTLQSESAIKTPQPHTPPPTSRKRRRSETDSSSLLHDHTTSLPSTPKRQRHNPPSLPLGLATSDFSALRETAAAVPLPPTPTAPLRRRRRQPLPYSHSAKSSLSPFSIPVSDTQDTLSPDSGALVSLILRKLSMRQSDWDECGAKASIGERFRMLVGDEAGGLRRGMDGRKRRSVAAMEFGPLLGDK